MKHHLDWEAGHGPVTGPINIAGATLAAGWVGHVAHMPPLLAAGVAGAGLIGHHIAGVRHQVANASLALRAATWIGAGAWCSWAMAAGPWSEDATGTLAAGAVGLGMVWAGERRSGREAQQRAIAAQEAEQRRLNAENNSELAAEWIDRIDRVCNIKDVRVVGIDLWETGSGYTLDLELPPGGHTWRQLAQYGDPLAGDAKLPEGCGVQVSSGAHRGAALMDVSTVNHLLEDIDYPDDYSPLSLNEPVPYGRYPDGSIMTLDLREASTLRVGQRGSGKTNEMNVGIANGVRMVDNLDWVIDLNGGGLALAWLHAWHKEGRPGRPPIDWVADTPEKALVMSRTAVAIAKARKPGYKQREIEANDDKLPVDATVPGIRVRCDEIAELFSPKALRDPVLREVASNLVQLMEIARAVAVNEDLAGLRATQDVISDPQLLKQSYVRVGLRVTDESELAYLFGWQDKAKPEDAPYPGSGLVKIGSAPARPFKVFRLKPAQIKDIVVACADRQPELDELSRVAAGEEYAKRWDGTDHLFGAGPSPAPASAVELTKTAPEQKRRSVTADWDSTPSADIGDALAEADAARDKLRQAMAENSHRDPDLEKAFLDIIDGGEVRWQPTAQEAAPAAPQPTPGVSPDARWPIVFRIVAQAGPAGIGPSAIRDRFAEENPNLQAPHRSAITDWVKAEPQIHQPMAGMYAFRGDGSADES